MNPRLLEAVLDLANFETVVPVGGAVKLNDALILVNGIELYKAAFSLSVGIRFSKSVNVDRRSFPRPTETILTDDLGTTYSLMNRGGSGGFMGDWQHSYAITPKLDPAAKLLTLEIPRLQIDAGMGFGAANATYLNGPWKIEMALPAHSTV